MLFSLLELESVKSAILSDALNKRSILTPSIWTVEEVHVQPLNPHPSPFKLHLLRRVNPLRKNFMSPEKKESDIYKPAQEITYKE